MTEEISSDQDNLLSIMTPRNLAEKTLEFIEIPSMINGGRLVSSGQGDLVKKMKLVLAWFIESLFDLNRSETLVSSVLSVLNKEESWGLE